MCGNYTQNKCFMGVTGLISLFLCSPKNPGFHRCQNVGAGDEEGEVIVLDFK